MTHLTADELIDAIEGLGPFTHGSPGEDGERQAHLATCEHCQRELASLSSVLADARQVSVPEPSPLFWQHFSERVRTAIDDEAMAGTHWPSWLRWPVLLPLGAVAMIVLFLVFAVPKQERLDSSESARGADPALEAPEAPQAPDNWVMLTELVGDIDLDTAAAVGVLAGPGDAERAVLHLTADEQQELTRLLKSELTRAKS